MTPTPPPARPGDEAAKKKTMATWTIELNCDCPHCDERVDLLEYADFWDAHDGSLEVGEHNSKRSKDVKVTCPKCSKYFLIDYEY